MNEKSKKFRSDIADMFVKSLNENPKTWRKEWFSSRLPFNGKTGTTYKGINRLMLTHMQEKNGWEDPRFMTFKQAEKKGYRVKSGEHGTHVEFWSPYDKESKKVVSWDEARKLDQKNVALVSRIYTVFNGSQIEGIPKYEEPKKTNTKPNEVVDKMAKSMGIKVIHGGDRAYYLPAKDEIHMPPINHFESDYAYAATLAHELSHATGNQHRLNRDQHGMFGSAEYAREELVAEISSCYICSELGIEQTQEHIDNHQAYVQHWAKKIKENPEVLTGAIKEADKAADVLMVNGGLMSTETYKQRYQEDAPTTADKNHDDFDEYAEAAYEPAPGEIKDGMVWVPPHTRKGQPVKGYWRKLKK